MKRSYLTSTTAFGDKLRAFTDFLTAVEAARGHASAIGKPVYLVRGKSDRFSDRYFIRTVRGKGRAWSVAASGRVTAVR